ncbi:MULTISPECIES: histone deacetylase family protein [Grimontia]|uniref:Acetylpolyamine aminohydrolase n=1 Tax=Grimontia marina TaxID=646534 RepID=A0A128FHV0_9GAMM|nr:MULTISPECIES: histone deacetylase family protein [Grimontia]WRW00847.1 histone deacetylase family protein [Grimontia sp. NTOU-MAR1]CZF85841.1 Acetylpolyamine aminohydrolase [Grimontia marina]
MESIFSEKHILRNAKTELSGGLLVEPYERPSRAEYIVNRIRDTQLGNVISPGDYGMSPIRAIHSADFVEFLQTAWVRWKEAGFEGEAIPSVWPAGQLQTVRPRFIEGQLGYYALAGETSLSEGTWEAAYESAQVALSGIDKLLSNESRGIFSLCRPPGHHATANRYGGYCFLNNVAIAAQYCRDNGSQRVAILDIDFHHGNGTQEIFYDRDDVLFVSLHGDPLDTFPFFWGHEKEQGRGSGTGYTVNYPMPPGTGFASWRESLAKALEKIAAFNADVLLVSLGVDTFENDPISFFKLKSDDYLVVGRDIAELGIKTQFVMEGGYDVEEIGINVVNVLAGFDSR